MLYKSSGILQYEGDDKLIVLADPGMADFYRSLIPKYYDINRPKYPAHITVVRTGKETVLDKTNWNKYNGETIDFMYDNSIQIGTVYFWLNIFCKRLEEIRLELGLRVDSPWTLPPEGFNKCFHMTLANRKEPPKNEWV